MFYVTDSCEHFMHKTHLYPVSMDLLRRILSLEIIMNLDNMRKYDSHSKEGAVFFLLLDALKKHDVDKQEMRSGENWINSPPGGSNLRHN